MTEMIERIARALCRDDGLDPDSDWTAGKAAYRDLPQEMKAMWSCYEPKARLAIEAMREPTDAMEQAFLRACDLSGACLWKTAYRTLIDAALEGPPIPADG